MELKPFMTKTIDGRVVRSYELPLACDRYDIEALMRAKAPIIICINPSNGSFYYHARKDNPGGKSIGLGDAWVNNSCSGDYGTSMLYVGFGELVDYLYPHPDRDVRDWQSDVVLRPSIGWLAKYAG